MYNCLPLAFWTSLQKCERGGGGRLHCLYPWWADATVDFMISGDYNVNTQIQQMVNLALQQLLKISNKGNLIGDATALVFLYNVY
uniref:Uncharacterized protein n=1 Tax=Quercus lobata TaxID=97700 RepID=A0A7N2LBV4_QUELO